MEVLLVGFLLAGVQDNSNNNNNTAHLRSPLTLRTLRFEEAVVVEVVVASTTPDLRSSTRTRLVHG